MGHGYVMVINEFIRCWGRGETQTGKKLGASIFADGQVGV